MDFGLVQGAVEIENPKDFLSAIRGIAEKHGVTIQAMNAGKLAGMRHVATAVEKAVKSAREGRNITKDLGMEILLYASGQRQIEKALGMGISEGKNEAVFVIVPENDAAAEAIRKTVHIKEGKNVDYSSDKRGELMKFFGITEEEVKAVGEGKIPQLVCERVVLLDLVK